MVLMRWETCQHFLTFQLTIFNNQKLARLEYYIYLCTIKQQV